MCGKGYSHPLAVLATAVSQRGRVMDGDSVTSIDRNIFVAFVVDHHLINALARGSDQIANVTLSQADRDEHIAVRIGFSILLGKCQ